MKLGRIVYDDFGEKFVNDLHRKQIIKLIYELEWLVGREVVYRLSRHKYDFKRHRIVHIYSSKNDEIEISELSVCNSVSVSSPISSILNVLNSKNYHNDLIIFLFNILNEVDKRTNNSKNLKIFNEVQSTFQGSNFLLYNMDCVVGKYKEKRETELFVSLKSDKHKYHYFVRSFKSRLLINEGSLEVSFDDITNSFYYTRFDDKLNIYKLAVDERRKPSKDLVITPPATFLPKDTN